MITVEFYEYRGRSFAPMLRHECGGVSGPDTIAEVKCKVRSTVSGSAFMCTVYILPDDEFPDPESVTDKLLQDQRPLALAKARAGLLKKLARRTF